MFQYFMLYEHFISCFAYLCICQAATSFMIYITRQPCVPASMFHSSFSTSAGASFPTCKLLTFARMLSPSVFISRPLSSSDTHARVFISEIWATLICLFRFQPLPAMLGTPMPILRIFSICTQCDHHVPVSLLSPS